MTYVEISDPIPRIQDLIGVDQRESAIEFGRSWIAENGTDPHVLYLVAHAHSASLLNEAECRSLIGELIPIALAESNELYLAEVLRLVAQTQSLRIDLQVVSWIRSALEKLGDLETCPMSIDISDLAWMVKVTGRPCNPLALARDERLSPEYRRALVTALIAERPEAPVLDEAAALLQGASVRTLARYSDPAFRAEALIQQATPPESIVLAPPSVIGPARDGLPGPVFVEGQGFRLFRLRNAIVTGGSSVIELQNGTVLCDYLDHPNSARYAPGSDTRNVGCVGDRILVREVETVDELDTGIFLLAPAAMEHGHLVPDTLSRFLAVSDTTVDPSIVALVDEARNPAAHEFVRLVGDRDLAVVPHGTSILVRELWIPLPSTYKAPHMFDWGSCGPGVSVWDPRGLGFVRSRLDLHTRPDRARSGRRALVVRRDGNARRALANSEAVRDLALEYGLAVIDFEGLSAVEQIREVASTSHLVAQAGAGAYNAAFLPAGAQMGTLIGARLFNWRHCSSALGSERIATPFVSGYSHEDLTGSWQVPMEADLDRLDQLLSGW